ncbi:SAM-dependent methyltransferase [Virgisporangium ochraceum]|uniref:Methyltransferase n=1 Tax=Virgisporangium ochraceum TaxID=65505 RepID=A0A8J4E8A1_9ACTN|nr:SAM-dependent methyltransferase [Virgisporangium ochraceum]GIJ65426.1 methyltransferase [Virgisporangium ochraceum]
MPEALDAALLRVRDRLLDADHLVRAVAAGRRRGLPAGLVRAEVRPVTLKAGQRVQVMTNDGSRPTVRNVLPGEELSAAVDALLAEPFGNWHVETTTETLQLRVTKRGEAQVHVSSSSSCSPASAHDRSPSHLIAPDDPLFTVLGATAAKRRQVDAFLRSLEATVDLSFSPLRIVDLGCGNAYLTFATYRYLSGLGLDVTVTGVDVRDDQRERNSKVAESLGWGDRVTFVAGTILDAPVDGADLVLALHACDTATDEALARAVGWRSKWVLAAPCCHHDVAAQLRRGEAPEPYGLVTRYGILRERFADVLTDGLRASLLRLWGYRVEVVEFVDSVHTPRNLLIRASYSGVAATDAQRAEYEGLTKSWGVMPRLEELLR